MCKCIGLDDSWLGFTPKDNSGVKSHIHLSKKFSFCFDGFTFTKRSGFTVSFCMTNIFHIFEYTICLYKNVFTHLVCNRSSLLEPKLNLYVYMYML
ncbi:unnamed protein product, partial [Brassica oleracea var. botrytis]